MNFKRLRILHITPCYEPSYEMGGVVRSTTLLCQEFARMGHDVTVFTTNANPLGKVLEVPINKEMVRFGVKVTYFPVSLFTDKFFYSPSFKKAVFKQIDEFNIAHLTAFWTYLGIMGGKAARLKNVPYIVSPRGTLNPYSLSKKRILKRTYYRVFEEKNVRGAGAIHYTTSLEKKSAHNYHKLSNPCFVVPNPVPVKEFANMPSREKGLKYFHLPDNAKVISFIGRIHKRKALQVLVRTMALLKERIPNLYLIIAGPDDGERKRLEDLVEKFGLGGRVVFSGYVNSEKKEQILAASFLAWLASFPGENFGHSAIEAMAGGVPVLLSKDVGVCENTIRDEAGILISHDPEMIANKILSIAGDEGKWEQMSGNAKNSAKQYAKEDIAKEMIQEYKKVIERHLWRK